jgi:hypothetical protein
MSSAEIRAAGDDEPDGWRFADGRASWCGRADAEDAAPRLCWISSEVELARAAESGDPAAIASWVTRAAMPAGLLHALAERCLEHGREEALAIATGRRRVDPRWWSALAERALAAGLVSVEDREGALTTMMVSDGEVLQMAALDDGALAVLERVPTAERVLARVRLFRAGAAPLGEGDTGQTLLEVEVGDKDPLSLLRASGGGSSVLLARVERASRTLSAWVLDADRAPRVARTRLEALPEGWTLAGERLWLHLRSEQVALLLGSDEPGEPIRRIARAQPPVLAPVRIVDGWLLVFGGASLRGGHAYAEELRWVKLDGSDEDRTYPWYQDVRHVSLADGRVWLVCARGVWGVRAPDPPRFRWAMGPMVAAVDGETLWFSFHNAARRENGVACVDLVTSAERWRHVLPERPGRIERVPGGVVACGQAWWWIADDGRIVENGRGFLALSLARTGKTAVFSTGEELLFVDAEGQLRRRVALDGRAQLVGSTGAHAIALTPQTLHAFDGGGRRVAQLPRQREDAPIGAFERATDEQHRLVDRALVAPGAVWVRDPKTLRRFTPGSLVDESGGGVVVAPGRLATMREQLLENEIEETGSRGPVIYTEPGLALARSWHLGVGNRYVGDDEDDVAAVDVSDGAVVTLVRCALAGPLEVRRASTLVLVDCTEESSSSFVEEGCFVVRVATGRDEVSAAESAA